MFLEQWSRDRIHRSLKGSAEYSRRLDSSMLTRRDIESHHLLKLKETLVYVYHNSSFYRELFDKGGIDPGHIHDLKDLARVPFTTSSDLSDSPYKFLCVSLSDVERMYTLNTGGTTGAPKRIFFTEEDLNKITDYMGAAMKTVAVLAGAGDSGYRVAILLPDGERASQANLLSRAIEKYGGRPIRIDVSLDYRGQFDSIRENKPSIVFGAVSRLWRITQEARQSHNLADIGVKVLFVTSDYLSEATRNNLRNAWGGDVYCHYGMTEMGFGGLIECSAHSGFHVNEADFIFEIVDPTTSRAREPGHEGELVFTTLSRRGMPLIRYKTGDLSRLIIESCTCGVSALGRVDKVAKRNASIVRIGMEEMYPSMFADVVYTIPEVVDYQPFISREGSKDSLSIKVEVTEGETKLRGELTRRLSQIPAIQRNIKAGLLTNLRVELVEPGSLRVHGRAKRLIIDQRLTSL